MKNGEISISVLYGVYVLREQAHAHLDILYSRKSLISEYLGPENFSSLVDRNTSRMSDIDSFFMDSVKNSDVGIFNFAPVRDCWSRTEDNGCLNPLPEAEILLLSFERTLIEWCTFVLSSPKIDFRQSKVFLNIARHAQMEIAFILSCVK